MNSVALAAEADLSVEEFIDLLHRSTLSARRPVDDRKRIEGMLRNADLTMTARTAEGLLVGAARALTDFEYCTYLSDLAVDVSYQRQGLGRRLLEFTHDQAGRHTNLILLAAPAAESYYPHIGLQAHPSCWFQPGLDLQ